MVVLRQVLNALPLVFFIDGLSVVRATACDQGSALLSMVVDLFKLPVSGVTYGVV